MPDFSFDRDRLVSAVDNLLEKLEDTDASDSAKIDNFLIIAVIADDDEEEGEIEYPVTWCESSRPHVKSGILHMTINLMDRGDIS